MRRLVLVLLAISAATAQPPARQARLATAIGDDYADGHDPLSRIERHMKTARRLGVEYLRCAFSWNGIEPEQGKYDWRFWDALVASAEKHRIGLIPYIAYTPRWAARESETFYKQPPRDFQAFADFMHAAASRYRGRIRSWEIWNEPDNKDYWTGTAVEFAELVALAAPRIREADPAATVVLGGMANGPSEFFRELIGMHRADRHVDVIALHAYPESWLNERAEEIFDEWLPAIRRLLEANGSRASLWLNEMGYADYRLRPDAASIYGTNVFYRYEHTPAYQAAMLFKMHVLTLADPTIALAGWYRIDDFPHSNTRIGTDLVNHHLGVVDTRGRRKQAFSAMRLFNRLFRDSASPADVRVTRAPSSQAVVRAFLTRNRAVIVGWLRSSWSEEVAVKSGTLEDARSESVSVEAPCRPKGKLRLYDPQGRRRSAPATALGAVRLTGDTVFIAEMTCTPPCERCIIN